MIFGMTKHTFCRLICSWFRPIIFISFQDMPILSLEVRYLQRLFGVYLHMQIRICDVTQVTVHNHKILGKKNKAYL